MLRCASRRGGCHKKIPDLSHVILQEKVKVFMVRSTICPVPITPPSSPNRHSSPLCPHRNRRRTARPRPGATVPVPAGHAAAGSAVRAGRRPCRSRRAGTPGHRQKMRAAGSGYGEKSPVSAPDSSHNRSPSPMIRGNRIRLRDAAGHLRIRPLWLSCTATVGISTAESGMIIISPEQ